MTQLKNSPPANRKSLFISMLLSNAIMLLLPITIGIVLYTNTENAMSSQAERANIAMLDQLQLSMDSKFKEVQQLSEQIVLNPKLAYLLETKEDDAVQLYNRVQFMWDYIRTYRNISSGFIEDFYIYMANSDTIIKPNVMTDSFTFYDLYYKFEGLPYEDWREQLTSHHNQTYLPVRTMLRNGSIEGSSLRLNDIPMRTVTFQQSLPIHELTKVKGSLVVLIDEAQIQEITRQVESGSGGAVYIVNQEHEIIAGSPGIADLPAEMLDELQQPSGQFRYELDGQDMTVFYTTSQQVGWHYLNVMPSDMVLLKVKPYKRLAIWLFVLCLVLGIVAAYIAAYRNYFPVKRMMEAVASGLRQPQKPTYNELAYIMDRLELSWNEEKQVKDKLNRQMPLMRANYLHRLIQGYMEEPEQMAQSLAFVDVRFPHRHFAVVLVQLDSIEGFAPVESEKQWALARFIVMNVAEDMADGTHLIYAIELAKHRLALLVNLDSEQSAESPADGLAAIVDRLSQLLGARFKLQASYMVSGIHADCQQLGEAYLEAVAAMEYQAFNRQQSIYDFNNIRQESLRYHYPVETELQLINCIRSGEKEQTAALLHQLYTLNFQDGSITPELGRCLVVSLAGTLLRVLNADPRAYRKLADAEIHPVRSLLACKSADEMFAKAKELYLMTAEAFQLERKGEHDKLLQDVDSFIAANFADPGLSLAMLADHVQMTPQYLSQLYKKASGRNLSEHLTQVRIDRSKELMQDPQLTNDQIAKMIGYTNDTVFIRVFKRVEGITPGKYRTYLTKDQDAPGQDTL